MTALLSVSNGTNDQARGGSFNKYQPISTGMKVASSKSLNRPLVYIKPTVFFTDRDPQDEAQGGYHYRLQQCRQHDVT